MTDPHQQAVFVEIGAAVVTVLATTLVVAPYGRHARPGWGPTVAARTGWIAMEAPAVLGAAAIFATGRNRADLAPLVMLSLWLFHYVRRAFVYPLRMPADSKRMPVLVVLLAITFNLLNAYVNAGWISDRGDYPTTWLVDPRFLIGTAVFFGGWHVNTKADALLLALKTPGDRSYRIPRGWLYEYVSCPNYFGEVVEWFGWAILTWSLAGLAFALYTAANLVPRALSHHRWYRQNFPDYPTHRKAVIPGLL